MSIGLGAARVARALGRAGRRDGGASGEAELLVAGVVLTMVGLLAAITLAGGSGLASRLGRARRLRESPPRRGSVPEERHRQIETAAAR